MTKKNEAMGGDPRPEGGSPTRIVDPRLRFEAHRALVWVTIVVIVGLAIYMAQALLVIFGGLVFATLIDGGARLLDRVLPIGRGLRIAIVLILTAAFLVWVGFFAGGQLAAQANEFRELITVQSQRLLIWLREQGISIAGVTTADIARQTVGGVGQLSRAVGGIIGGFTTGFLIIIIGIYVAIEPNLYERGVAWMMPRKGRESFLEMASKMAYSMRRLLFGRLIGMLVEGVLTWVALAVYGVPMAGLLGLLTGLLAFIPNVGAVISGLLMVLVGFSGGLDMALYAFGVYVFIQVLDGYVIIPMIAKKTVDLAPALVLGAQLVLGILFGILGLALADPLVAMIKSMLEHRASEVEDETVAEAVHDHGA